MTLLRQSNVLLNDICVQFHSAKITAIVGANGAGKSTLLKALLGEFPEIIDTVQFKGRSAHSYSLSSLSKQRAYVCQHAKPAFSLAVFEYLLLQREMHDESQATTQAMVAMAASLFGINRLLERDLLLLSGGEAQLVEFTRAYLQLYSEQGLQGKCLLLDEPASALDVKQTSLLYHHLLKFKEQGATIILVDHDINAMAQIADHIVLLKYGKLIATGTKQDVFTRYNLNRCFDVAGHLYDFHELEVATSVVESSKNSKGHAVFHVPIKY
jgi:iron complex transport system ATP-binding protein